MRRTTWPALALIGGFILSLTLLCGPAAACIGDCNDDGQVTIDELVLAVDIALGEAPAGLCPAIDVDGDGRVTISELVRGVDDALQGCRSGPAGEVLFSAQDNELDTYPLSTAQPHVLIPASRETVNGQVCRFQDGSGNLVLGDDTGQPASRPGWGIFSPDGTLLKKLPLPERPDETLVPDPLGCALDAEGRLFTTAIGTPGGDDGLLIVYFAPRYDESCILDDGLRTPGTLATDPLGNLYVPEATPPGRVLRYSSPFPSSADECGTRVPVQSTFIQYTDAVASFGIARAPDGDWYVSIVVGLDGAGPTIREHDADGTFVRELIVPGTAGNPAGLAVDSEGSIYYADLGLDDEFSPRPGGGTVRRLTFDALGNPRAPTIFASGLTFPDSVTVLTERPAEWLMLGGSLRRTYFNPNERGIRPDNVARLIPKWRYFADAIITGSPVVASIDLPGEGPTQVVFASSFDRHLYALRAENGSRVWSFETKAQAGASYPWASSPTIAWLEGRPVVYVGGGMTMYCLDATTGEEVWQFDAGTGCTDCDRPSGREERNEVESSPAVIDGLVLFGMDVNDRWPGKGGLYAVHADDGRLAWYFDLETQSTCTPLPEDNVRRFDGFHTALELGLTEDFFATRPGCDFDRAWTGCGNVWSSAAVDARRRLFYIASSNCDTDEDPETPAPPPPMPPHDQAIFAVSLDGEPAWVWRPRDIDNDDLSFGAVPNLFEVEIDGAVRDVVGIGGKDGTYYLLDRDGVNPITGKVEPYWSTNVVPGGSQGGIIASAAVVGDRIFFSTAPGNSVFEPQKPSAHALAAADGSVVWQNFEVSASFAPNSAVPGLVFVGGTPGATVSVLSMDDGVRLTRLDAVAGPSAAGIASPAVAVAGVLFTGAGVGAQNSGEAAGAALLSDTPVSAFCVEGAPGCQRNPCDDGDVCTYDYLRDGECMSEPAADGLDCPNAASPTGTCQAGVCQAGVCVGE